MKSYTISGTLSFVVKFPHHNENTSHFELYENNRLLATGSICKLDGDDFLEVPESASEPQLLPLTAEDIYTDLRLRGFQYSGRFHSIKESDNRGIIIFFNNTKFQIFQLI